MGIESYEELVSHIGHKIVCVEYGDKANVAVECETCMTVLLDFEKPSGRWVVDLESFTVEAETTEKAREAAEQEIALGKRVQIEAIREDDSLGV